MKLYITRHGQVSPHDYHNTVDFPEGDIPLTELGKLQAKCLGKKLSDIGFKGIIYSSPYRRTMQTAEAAARESGNEIVPSGALRESFFALESAEGFKGMNLEELRQEFNFIKKDAQLEFPWWKVMLDGDVPSITERAKPIVDEIIMKNKDAMIVGHGASVVGSINYLFNFKYKDSFTQSMDVAEIMAENNLNCNLSCIEIENGELIGIKMFMTEFLSDDMLTSNTRIMKRAIVREKRF